MKGKKGDVMKAIIVYYSLEENTKYAAEEIAVQLEAATLRLEPVNAYPTGMVSKFFWGGKSVITGERPHLRPYQFRADDYDMVIIGTPVWAGTYTPPISTFLAENDLRGKKVGIFACSSSGNAEKCFRKLKGKLQCGDSVPTMSLQDPGKKLSGSDQQRIDNFCEKVLTD